MPDFDKWDAFEASLAGTGASSEGPGPLYTIDLTTNTLVPRRELTDREWETVLAVMEERGITGLQAEGQMTDALLAHVARLDHVTRLTLGGSRQVTDEGLRQLARMPQLRDLDLGEYPGGRLTDRGLEVLRHLPDLRTFSMVWQRGISDAGVAHLRGCDRLESVDLMGSPTGDGAIDALRGKPHLRRLKTGRLVTDAGVAMLREFPGFKTWRQDDDAAIKAAGSYSLMSFDAGPTRLLLDGSFTNQALADLARAGLDGLFSLGFFWHLSALTADGLAVLPAFPHLGLLGCQDALCNDIAMRHIAAIPTLRMLMAQGAVATDEGFETLARSRTLEYLWGRDCPNLTSRGFRALSRMPSLRGLGVSCVQVDDDALATLPDFPALRELMPMDVHDEGFRHVGRCQQLDTLWCMYCRDTTDRATEHIVDLSRLQQYYAGATQITNRSLELLSRMPSLRSVELYECKGITRAGLSVFPAHVQVEYVP